MGTITLEHLAKIRAAKMENRKRNILLNTQMDSQRLSAQAQADIQDEQLSLADDLARAQMAHDEKVRKETQRTKEKAAKEQGKSAPPPEPGLGESGNPEPILQPPQPINPSQPASGPTLSPAPVNNYGQPGGPQPGSPGQQGGAGMAQGGGMQQGQQYGGPPVDPYLMATQSTEGMQKTLTGGRPNREVTTTIKPNRLSAYESATIGQQELETRARVQAAQQGLILARNKTFVTAFKDLAPEVGTELAARLAQAASLGDMEGVAALSEAIPETNTGRLIKQKIRSETARQASSYASAGASRASATNSYASANATNEKRLDTLLGPLAAARANRKALSPEQRQVLDSQVAALPNVLKDRLDQLSLGSSATPLSTVGKTAADLDVSLPEMSPEDRMAIVKQVGDRSTKIDLGLSKVTEAKVEGEQLKVSRARDSLDRTQALVSPNMFGMGARTANVFTRFAKDKAGLPLVPTVAQLGAQAIMGMSKAELDNWDRNRLAAFASAGRETAQVINDLFGTAVNEREDKRAQQFVNELQTGDPEKVMAVLGEAQLYANIKLASYSLWRKNGKKGQPWDVPDTRVAEALWMDFQRETQSFLDRGAQSETVAKAAAQRKIERDYGLSTGMAPRILKEYGGYGR